MLVLYGIVPTYQPAPFGHVYAAYGGWFVVLSILWGWGLDRISPDRYDLISGLICLIGLRVIDVLAALLEELQGGPSHD